MSELTNEELNKKIAAAKGWDQGQYNPQMMFERTFGGIHYIGKFAWSTDIVAAFTLEDEIPQSEWYTYYRHLEREVALDDKNAIWTDEFDDEARMEVHRFQLVHATARQRSLAWLAWKEGSK